MASNPPCFGQPLRCKECRACAVRFACYREHSQQEPVHLLPVDRPALTSEDLASAEEED